MNEHLPIARKVSLIYGFLSALNAGAWLIAFAAFRSHPITLGTALLAYAFGLRHAVDADHIAAIDNVTRKLMQEGKRPASVGFFFSLGHSTIVVLLAVAITVGANAVRAHISVLQSTGATIGTIISALFLLTIAAMNVAVLAEVLRAFNRERREGFAGEAALEQTMSRRGVMGRVFRPLLAMVDASWKMYPIGILFGLGFDTATEVGLLGIAAIEAGKGLPIVDIMIFPLLFTAGMALLDTTDGILMLGAYGWAFVKPVRKLCYNVTVTLVSIFVALFVGSVESLGLIGSQLKVNGGFWPLLDAIENHIDTLGGAIIATFLISWIVSAILYRLNRGVEPERP